MNQQLLLIGVSKRCSLVCAPAQEREREVVMALVLPLPVIPESYPRKS